MAIGYRHGISILELIIYFPSLVLSIFLVTRHGLKTNSGFLFLTIFTLIRIAGACCDLATINDQSDGLYIAAAICSSVGLSPLLLTCSGLLSRADLSIESVTGRNAFPRPTFPFFRLLTIAAVVVSITGITADMSAEGLQNPDIKVKIGMILYIACWVLMNLILAILALRMGSIERGEKRNLLAVALSSPFLLIRLVYAICIWFLHDPKFSMFDGNMTIQLVMSVLEEFAVVAICLAVGMTLRVRTQDPRVADEEEILQPRRHRHSSKS